jgi:hypothetical protein
MDSRTPGTTCPTRPENPTVDYRGSDGRGDTTTARLGRGRIEDGWEDAGFADYFRPDALCVIEWPERVRGMLPAVDVALSMHYREAGRDLSLKAGTLAGNECLAAFDLPVR